MTGRISGSRTVIVTESASPAFATSASTVTLRLEIPGARGFTLTGDKEGFHVLSQDAKGDVTVRFKSPADAFRVFTGQIGVAQAYGEHRFVVKGNLSLALAFTRCVDRVEGYLFPAVLAKRILKRLPKKEVSSLRVYASVLLGC